jgi:hypothetical protein
MQFSIPLFSYLLLANTALADDTAQDLTKTTNNIIDKVSLILESLSGFANKTAAQSDTDAEVLSQKKKSCRKKSTMKGRKKCKKKKETQKNGGNGDILDLTDMGAGSKNVKPELEKGTQQPGNKGESAGNGDVPKDIIQMLCLANIEREKNSLPPLPLSRLVT